MADEHEDSDDTLEKGLARLERLASSRQREEVIRVCTSLLQRFPDEGELYYRRAHARNVLGDTGPALADMLQAVKQMPGEPAAAFFCGLWSIDAGNYADVVHHLTTAAKLEEQGGSSYYLPSSRLLCAFGYALLGDFGRAKRAMTGLPDDADFFVRNRMWTLPELKKLVAHRRRP